MTFTEITSHSGMTHLAASEPTFTTNNHGIVEGRVQALCGFHIRENAAADGRRCEFCEAAAEKKLREQ